jgi:hypothetical protein
VKVTDEVAEELGWALRRGDEPCAMSSSGKRYAVVLKPGDTALSLAQEARAEIDLLRRRIAQMEKETSCEARVKLRRIFAELHGALKDVPDARIQHDALSLAHVAAKHIVALKGYVKGLSEMVSQDG